MLKITVFLCLYHLALGRRARDITAAVTTLCACSLLLSQNAITRLSTLLARDKVVTI